MLSESPVVRSATARGFFFTSALISIACLYGAEYLGSLRASRLFSPIFYWLFTYYDLPGAIGALLILIAAVFCAIRLPSAATLRWFGSHAWHVAAGCVIVFSVGSLVAYRNHPLSMDEYAAYFQSQVFAAGHLAGQFPPALLDWLIPRYFQNYFLFVSRQTGEVVSGYWPSFSLLLTPFTALGIPWACNPVLSGATVLVVHRLAINIFDDLQAAGAAVLFTIASPVFFADGISYYSMQAHLLANSLYLLLLLRPTVARMALAGVVGSIALTLHNPFPHILFAAPCWLWVARHKQAAKLIPALAAGYLPLSLLLGIGWLRFYTALPHEGGLAAAGSSSALDAMARFGSVFSLPTAGLLLARAVGLAKIWVWAVPGLALLACAGAWKCWANPICRLLSTCALLTLAGYLLVPDDQGHGWGYRYFHSAWMSLPLLAAGALSSAKTSLPISRGTSFAGSEVRSFVVACALLSLAFGVGLRAQQIHEFVQWSVGYLPAQACPKPCVLFVNPIYYSADLIQNDPWLRGGVIRMISSGADDNAKLMSQIFPDMHLIKRGPSGEVWSTAPSPSL